MLSFSRIFIDRRGQAGMAGRTGTATKVPLFFRFHGRSGEIATFVTLFSDRLTKIAQIFPF
jgi:hypothetical protein